MKLILTVFLSIICFGLRAANPAFSDLVWTNDTLNIKQRSVSSLGITGTVFNIGLNNVGIGEKSLKANIKSNNVAIGLGAMSHSVSGYGDVAVGFNVLTNDTSTGSENVAVGRQAMEQNDDGFWNVAIGEYAMKTNRTGSENVAIGFNSMRSSRFNSLNVSIGSGTMGLFDSGFQNTVVGPNACTLITTMFDSTALGYDTLDQNASSTGDTALGSTSMASISTATTGNTAAGFESLRNAADAQYNVGVGYQAGKNVGQATNVTWLGAFATSASGLTNATAVGANAYVGQNNTITLGSASTIKVVSAGYYIATNGFASYSTISTNAIGATGYTNNQVINQTAYVTATAVAFTIKDRAGNTLYVSPVMSATIPINLQPGWSITSASGLVGTVLPF